LGNSDTLTVGEPVVVVGSPVGLETTVTAGILSAIRDGGEGYTVLQTDAAVNHGNSGGPLVNASGLAVGVVSSILRADAAQGLNFAIPINYLRGLTDNLHDPMTLEQMRSNLVGTTSAKANGGPSLRETLDWLREKIPLAANHYVSAILEAKEVTIRTIPRQFESCTINFDLTEVDTWGTNREYPTTTTTRQTIPLGALAGGRVAQDVLALSFAASKLDRRLERWTVFLDASSKVILSETYEDLYKTTKSESQDWAFLTFYDEAMAKRVLEAFKHAADLCRVKDPF